jgi:hypothetical protein
MMSRGLKNLMGTTAIERGCPKIWSGISSVVVWACRIKDFRVGAGMRGKDLTRTDPTRGYLRTGKDLIEKNKILELNCAGNKGKEKLESRVFRAIREMSSRTIEARIEATGVKLNIALIVTVQGT